MSSSDGKDLGEVAVRSKTGPIRIELLDDRLNRQALGFGELRARVRPGLYTLQYNSGTTQDEDIVRVEPGRTVTREVCLGFAAVAPIGASTTAHEFHSLTARDLSLQPKRHYGNGGGLMIFARTIDADGMKPVPIEQLSLLDARLLAVGNLGVDAERRDDLGFACLSAAVDPGGYALRWGGAEAVPVDQSLWVSRDWMTMVFLGYRSQSGRLERQSASIYMTSLGVPFEPGPELRRIRESPLPGGQELKDVRINQALDLALAGLRSGDQVVPDDLVDLLLESKFRNPMLGIVGCHALIRRHKRDWDTFDVVVKNLETLIPGHPDVAALRLCGNLLRGDKREFAVEPLEWPPMLCAGYKGLIDSDWMDARDLIADESVAERAAAALLPESPWTCWQALDPAAPLAAANENISLAGLSRYLQQVTDTATAHGSAISRTAFGKASLTGLFGNAGGATDLVIRRASRHIGKASLTGVFGNAGGTTDLVIRRVSRHIARLGERGEDADPSSVSLDDFRHLGLPVGVVKKALRLLIDTLDLENDPPRIKGR